MTDYSKYKEYAIDILSGKILSCNNIKLACGRYLSRFDNDEMYFDIEDVEKKLKILSKIKFFDGARAGQTITIEPWQLWCIYNIYGFKWKKNNKRVTRNVMISVGRKNGKSMFCAWLGLIGILEEPSAEIDYIANDTKQASILFNMTKNILEGIDPKHLLFKPYRNYIKFDATKSIMQVHSADAKTKDGFNSSITFCDEYGASSSSDLLNVFKSSQLAREQPLSIILSTAGMNLSNPMYELKQTYEEILNGAKIDDSVFAAIYELDADDDWKDINNYIKSNPNLGVSISKDALEASLQEALNSNIYRQEFIVKHCNRWVQTATVWLAHEQILKCIHKDDWRDYQGNIGYIGVDLASVCDLTSVSLMMKTYDGFYKFWNWYYLPQMSIENNPNSEKYKQWARDGHLIITPGNVCDYQYILKQIVEISRIIQIEGVFYDSWNAVLFAIEATEMGLNMCPYSQSIGNFNKPTKEVERAILSEQALIHYNPITLWCFQNVEIKQDWNQNSKPVKKGDVMGKIDGVIALIQALGGYLVSNHVSPEVISI